eukprot:m.1668497 g.1668497  ORF g.1668497 m.1668497 type:complete len:56 (+) comp152990_c0_seq1:1-168(+)
MLATNVEAVSQHTTIRFDLGGNVTPDATETSTLFGNLEVFGSVQYADGNRLSTCR